MGWGGSCRGGWGGGGSCRGGVGVGHTGVGWVMQGWGRSCRGGVEWIMKGGVDGSCRVGWVM